MLNCFFDCRIKFDWRHEITLNIAFKLCSGTEFLHPHAANRKFSVTYFTHHI